MTAAGGDAFDVDFARIGGRIDSWLRANGISLDKRIYARHDYASSRGIRSQRREGKTGAHRMVYRTADDRIYILSLTAFDCLTGKSAPQVFERWVDLVRGQVIENYESSLCFDIKLLVSDMHRYLPI